MNKAGICLAGGKTRLKLKHSTLWQRKLLTEILCNARQAAEFMHFK